MVTGWDALYNMDHKIMQMIQIFLEIDIILTKPLLCQYEIPEISCQI